MKKLFLVIALILFGCGPAISYDMQNSWREVDEATDEVQAAQPLPDTVLIPPGGTTGQILMKQSNADGDMYWADPPSAPPSGCDPLTDELGWRQDGGTVHTTSAGVVRAVLYTPDCNGVLTGYYLQRGDADQAEVRLMVYLDDGDGIPNIGDTLVDSMQIDLGTSSGWHSATSSANVSVSTSNHYWLISVISSTASVTMYYTSNATESYTRTGMTSWYDTPPANLDGSWTHVTDRGNYSCYVTLQ